MRRLRALAAATHALPTAAVTGFCVATARAAGVGRGRAALLGAAVLTGQASVGWMNDWLDADRDRIAGRLDKPVVRGEVDPGTLRTATLLAGTACVGLSAALGRRPAAAHLTAVGAAWAYDAGLKATPLSPVPYAVAFGLVPGVLVAGSLPGSPPPRWPVPVTGSLLGVAAHLANGVADTAYDARTGVRGLPQRLGPRRSVLASAALIAAGATVLLGDGMRAAPATGPADHRAGDALSGLPDRDDHGRPALGGRAGAAVTGGRAGAAVTGGRAGVAVAAGSAAVAVAATSAVLVVRGRGERWAFRAAIGAAGLVVVAFVSAGGARLVAPH